MSNAPSETPVLTALFEHWSSHPKSLKRQRKWWFAIGLLPIAAVIAVAALILTGTSGWRAAIAHPTIPLLAAAGAAALSFGLVLSFALLHLVARAGLAQQTDDPDSVPFPQGMVMLFAFFWIVPAALSFAQTRFGIRLVPQQMAFVLNALCFAPFLLILLWVRFADDGEGKRNGKTSSSKVRRPLWFILGLLFLGLAGLSLIGDLQGWVRAMKLPPALSGLSTIALRTAALSTLLPLSMVCFAAWSLFRRQLSDEEIAAEMAGGSGTKTRKSIWSRFLDFLRGRKGGSDDAAADTKNNDTPPKWLATLCCKLPDGVRIASREPPKPDRLPAPGSPTSPNATSPDAEALWMLMGGEEDRRPTELQFRFFSRFCSSVEEVRAAAEKGNDISADIILSGDEGTGRTEALLAAAMYAAFARRQRVLFLVADVEQAANLSDKADKRFHEIFLDCFLRCGVLCAEKAQQWVMAVKSRADEHSTGGHMGDGDTEIVPPNILFATPRDVERIFFEGRGVDADGSSIAPLRDILRLFEVVIVDDFMELDVTERAHLPFLLHKLRMILVSGNLRPQFVVATPRLREEDGVQVLADRLFDSRFNLSAGDGGNAITLLPRECSSAWSLPLVMPDDRDAREICEAIVRECLALADDSGKPLGIVLYRKGLHPHQCRELAARLAPAGEGHGNLQVVSRIDEIDSGAGADAIFYLTALAGRAEMALRLSVGDENTVYISLSSESEAIYGADGEKRILPAIPDSTAVALRIHHLRSLLRFVTPGQPVDLFAWERFGVMISEKMRVAEIAEDAVVHEKWRQDEWEEPGYGQPPLWPYIVFEGDGSVKSNAGKGTDFGILPYTDEDVAQLGDNPLIGLIKPKTIRDGKVENVDVGAGSIAKWIDDQDIAIGAIDLAHNERLVFGRSALGDIHSSASNSSDSVFTVDGFVDGDEGCVCKLRKRPWNGDGMDFDMPVRTMSWTIESVSVPSEPAVDAGRAFTFFDLPDCRGLPRVISASICGLVNGIGQSQPTIPPRPYSYPAYFSGLLLAPRRLNPRDGIAQIQRGVVGQWNTEDGVFSAVLSHFLSGLVMRVIPDLPFYATIPVFHQRGKEEAVAAAVAWVIQPINSGKTIHGLLRALFQQPKGQASVLEALREARGIFESKGDAKSRLRWLRSFSRSAFALDLDEPGRAEAFEKDVQWSLEILSVIESRLSGTLAEIEEFSAPVPEIFRDHDWMSEPRAFDQSGFLPESVWSTLTEFPEPPAIGRPGVALRWHYCGKEFTLEAGFAEKDGGERYNGFLDAAFRSRISCDSYVEYGFNDPYREFIGNLCDALRQKFESAFPGANETKLAEFLLSFVQEGLPYVRDPKNKTTDWPRHPSETLLRFGGDCEDSSILYAELLRRFRIGGAMLSVPEHAAVGVCVPLEMTADRHEPIIYTWLGRNYVYAETACDKNLCALGSETELIRSAEDVPADVIPTPDIVEDETTPVRILNAVGRNSSSLEITLVAPGGTTSPLAVAVFARPRKAVFEAPDSTSYPCVGGANLPTLAPRKVFAATLKLATPQDFRSYWYDVFVCESVSGAVRGHFVGVARFGT